MCWRYAGTLCHKNSFDQLRNPKCVVFVIQLAPVSPINIAHSQTGLSNVPKYNCPGGRASLVNPVVQLYYSEHLSSLQTTLQTL